MNYYNADTIIWFHGAFVKAHDAMTDLYGQTLHYGYGVFEGIRSYHTADETRIFKAHEHYERLRFSAHSIGIPLLHTADEMTALTYEVLKKNALTNAYIRPIVVCPPNMSLSNAREAMLAITAWEWNDGYLHNNMRVMTSSYCRPNPRGFKVEAKVCGHYVNSILACQEAKSAGYDEALVLDEHGFVAEGPGANIFYERDGILFTPPKGNILPGITRATILELCKAYQIEVREEHFTPDTMYQADAIFYCGTAAEVVAIAELDGYTVRKEWQDTQSAILQRAYKQRVLLPS
jgi:branched-chain amino acid aminotransferase